MESLSYLLIKGSRYLKYCLDISLKEYGITVAQFAVLNQIMIKEGKITSAEIAEILSLDRPTISGIVNRLEDKNLLTKTANQKDKRSAYLELNTNSKALIRELKETTDDIEKEIFSMFTDNELDHVRGFLNKLIKQLEERYE